jgi:peptidyl-prolyl cis-trans isomerase D
MLQTMRDSLQGIIAYCIVGVIIVIFALFGVEALVQGKAVHRDAIITVNGKDVTELDIRRGMEMRKQQLAAMMGGKVDPQFLTDEFLRKPVEDGLVRRRLLESVVEENHLQVSSNVIDKQIVSDKNFQQDGKFDKQHYTYLLGMNGFTPATYRDELTKEYLLNQFQDGFLHTGFVTGKEADELARLQLEKRSFEYLQLPLAKTLTATTASEDEIKAYYDKHKDQFLSEDKVSVDYVELNRDLLSSGMQVKAEDVQKQYDAEIQAAKNKVTRHAAHILVEEKPDGSQQAILKEIQQRLAKGEDFAALAKQYSADAGSAQQGGDVGETTGDSFVPEFEAVLQKLSVGQVSEPVKTKFGYHIIKLLDQKQPKIETLEASRARLETDIRKQQAAELYADKLEVMRDVGQGEAALADVVAKLALATPLPVQHRDAISRREAMMMFRGKSVADAIFADGMEAGKLTDVIEPEQGRAVLLRVTDRKHPVIQSLEQVHAQVDELVRKEKGAATLATRIQALQTRLLAGESLEKLAKEDQLEWKNLPDKGREESSVNVDILKKVFAMPAPEAAHVASDTLALASGDTVLVHLLAVQTPTVAQLTDEQKAKTRDQLESSTASHEFAALENMLEAQARIIRKQTAASH